MEKFVETDRCCALGRVPNLHGLNLEQAGVVAEHGKLICRPFQQTNVPHIFAGGDVDSS